MRQPAFFPPDLPNIEPISDDESLLQLLVKTPHHFIRFFVAATQDETWLHHHLTFLEGALKWLTREAFYGRLSNHVLKEVAQAIFSHSELMDSLCPKNIAIKIQKELYPVNSLLLSAQSNYLNMLILRQCRDRKKNSVTFPDIPYETIPFILRYFNTGQADQIWRLEEEEIKAILEVADILELETLSKECQNTLKRYINSRNLVDTLLLSHRKHWLYLKESCIDFFNQQEQGIILSFADKDSLNCEFSVFNDQTWRMFLKFNIWVTHLKLGGLLPMDEFFLKLLKNLPRLISLDLSGSEKMSPFLENIPKQVRELKLSRCQWLNDDRFRHLVRLFEDISALSLEQNTDLSYMGWSELRGLRNLKSLNLASCTQIGNRELSLILQAAPQLNEINLMNCPLISDSGFIELAQMLARLNRINLAKTSLTDLTVIELANHARFIEEANFSKNSQLTEKALEAFVKNEANLRLINLVGCKIPEGKQSILQMNYPRTTFIF
ncbi:MAG: BTB/POZ domain-containing protein [Parachlamydiaceae bacterium]